MNIIALVLKYALCIMGISYFITTGWSFYKPWGYVLEKSFQLLYLATLPVVIAYIIIIECTYCALTLADILKEEGIARAKRKKVFFVASMGIISCTNLLLLNFAFSTKGENLVSSGYLLTGFPLFLMVFLSYAALIWCNPYRTMGFWMLENVLFVAWRRIESKNTYRQVQSVENKIELDVATLKPIGARKIVLMDILLMVSSRDGVYIYLRSGCCLYTSTKVRRLFTDKQLSWFVEYQKGMRGNLMHIGGVSANGREIKLMANLYNVLQNRQALSDFEMSHLLKLSPVYKEKIAQEIKHKKKLNKAVLSQVVYLKTVFEMSRNRV